MTIKVIFDVNSFRNLALREGWLDKADIEVRSYLDGEIYHIATANEPGEKLNKVALLIGKYTSKHTEPIEVANLIAWNCTHVIVKE